MAEKVETFGQAVTEGIARAIGEAFSGSALTPLLRTAGVHDVGEGGTKWKRIHDGLVHTQAEQRSGQRVLNLVKASCEPARWVGRPAEFAELRRHLNQTLAFAGFDIDERAQIRRRPVAASLDDIAHLTQEMRDELKRRGGHAELFKYCTQELIAEDCFGAVFEGVKGLADRIRTMANVHTDGNQLVQDVFEGQNPRVVFNTWATPSEKSEQRGLADIMKGIFGAFRNPQAHEPRVRWHVDTADALDLLTTLSLLHRRLDAATVRRS